MWDALRLCEGHGDVGYLHCEKRLSEAGPLDLIWFEDARRAEVEAFLQTSDCQPYLPALEETAAVIDGFESPLGMELLATVDWIVSEMKCEASLSGIKEGLGRWPGEPTAAQRKQKLFDDRLLELAVDRLNAASLAN